MTLLPVCLISAAAHPSVADEPKLAAFNADSKSKESRLVAKTYKVQNHPVWTENKEFSPTVLMQLIQATVSPNDWEADGGKSSMAPYYQKAALVITTRHKNHDKILKRLGVMRPQPPKGE